jgi:helix-turn-helix, Psq domain
MVGKTQLELLKDLGDTFKQTLNSFTEIHSDKSRYRQMTQPPNDPHSYAPTPPTSINHNITIYLDIASPFKEQINGALESIRTHQYPSIRAAAKAYGVNHRTLTRRLRGGLLYTQARQPQLLLSPE